MSANLCPNCKKPAAPDRTLARDPHFCRCRWEDIALAYERQGEKDLAYYAWQFAKTYRLW